MQKNNMLSLLSDDTIVVKTTGRKFTAMETGREPSPGISNPSQDIDEFDQACFSRTTFAEKDEILRLIQSVCSPRDAGYPSDTISHLRQVCTCLYSLDTQSRYTA